MFHNGKKTLGVFINRAEMNFQQILSKSLIETAQEKNYNVAFMTSYGIRESKNMYDIYEKAIVDFAPIEEFDAIIIASDTYDTPAFREKLICGLKERAVCPVISFREEIAGFYSVLTNANQMAGELVRHLVVERHAKHICFMAGYEGHYDSSDREAYYRQAMKKYQLPIYENSVFYGDMWKGKGEEAYRFFFSDNAKKPDAVICANDFMARALCDALQEHGIRVPEDVWISGFDNSPESREYAPYLTTVAVDFKAMAREAVILADDLIHGKKREKKVYLPAQIYYREEIEYEKQDMERLAYYRKEHYREMNTIIEKHNQQNFFSVDMDGCSSYQEMKRIIGDNLKLIGDYDEFYLCLLGKVEEGVRYFTSDITAKAKLEIACRRGKNISAGQEEFYQKELLPECVCDEKMKVYYFSILHNREKNFGYTALSFCNPAESPDIFYHDWNFAISLALNDYFIRQQMQSLIKKNHEESITDYLTRMYNRRGMEHYVRNNWDRWISEKKRLIFVSIDIDGLKKINDAYGHKEGDWTICAVAESIRKAVEGFGVAGRTGGDEFVAVLTQGDENAGKLIESCICENLVEFNSGKKPYRVGCSVGYYVVQLEKDSSYDACIRNSDMKMYKIKQQKKEKGG